MFKISNVGRKLYFSVLTVFLVFAVSFIVFQQMREKQYKISTLTMKLEGYNALLEEDLALAHDKGIILKEGLTPADSLASKDSLGTSKIFVVEDKLDAFVRNHESKDLRVTLVRPDGKVVYDNMRKDYDHFANHINRKEIQEALKSGQGSSDHNESLEIEDLASFPNDELGEIAERIIKMYKRIQTTRKEQDILKRQLTQNIAHELKTPVASIQGYLETILDNPHINDEMKAQFLQRCYAQSERLTSLLRDISTLNRLDDGSDMIDFEAVDITKMVADIARETTLEREGREQGNKWHFIFRDNGQGVPQEHLPRLFERFYRVDKGRSRKMGGTGLGLAIVKNAVLLHGGTIRVSNLPEGGLKFEFTIKK